MKTVKNLDGTRTEYEDLVPDAQTLESLLRDVFERHWKEIVFGPCIQGSVFEVRMTEPPKKVSMLDGYMTVDLGPWHLHLCLGENRKTHNGKTPPALARHRKCSRVAFFRDIREKAGACVRASFGLRLWNGKREQMMTVFFPNPWLNDRMKMQARPDWSRLAAWNSLRGKYLGRKAFVPA